MVISSSVPLSWGMFVHSLDMGAFADLLEAKHLLGGSRRHAVMGKVPTWFALGRRGDFSETW